MLGISGVFFKCFFSGLVAKQGTPFTARVCALTSGLKHFHTAFQFWLHGSGQVALFGWICRRCTWTGSCPMEFWSGRSSHEMGLFARSVHNGVCVHSVGNIPKENSSCKTSMSLWLTFIAAIEINQVIVQTWQNAVSHKTILLCLFFTGWFCHAF